MRTENHNGNWILCGAILPTNKIQPGQVWQSSGNSTVRVTAVRDGWVCYTWIENGSRRYHEKDAFAFQCRYCLVLPSEAIPDELIKEQT